jgi:hypothetical protein
LCFPRGTLATALILATGLSSGALAQDKIDSAQRPPAEATPQTEQTPARCTSEQSGFRALNGVNTFYVEVTSACEKRQRCTINAHVVGSRGGKTGQGTITLPPGSAGQETKRTWAMRTAENGGMANMSWNGKDL